jgi:hypothetical protein
VAILPAITSPAGITEPVVKEIKAEDYEPISDSKNVEKYINDYFADIPILIQIAKCESRFRHLNSQGEILRGTENRSDRGVMQINVHYHGISSEKLGYNIHEIEDNVAYARHLYERQGVKPWMSSSACWAKFRESEIARK